MKIGHFLMIGLVIPAVVTAQNPTESSFDQPTETTTAAAETPAAEDTEAAPAHVFDTRNNDRLTGDWGGARSSLEDKGIEFGFSMTNIYQHNAHGGLQTHRGHRFSGSFDYELTLDFEAMGLWDGGLFYILAESDWNDGIGEDRVGNLFGVNGDAGGDISLVVDEAWYEHTFWGGKARFRIGKMDVGVDFDTNAYANDETAQFLNPALVGTGNIPMPDFGLGMQLVLQPADWVYVGLVATDAQADGRETGFRTALHDEDYFYAGLEFGFLPVWDTQRGKLPGTYRFGVWYDPQPKGCFFNDLGGRLSTGPTKRDDVGFYFGMDQLVCKEHPDDDPDDQGLGVFFRYGYAHQEVNEIEHFWSLGAQYLGLIPSRDDDVLGFGFAQGILSDTLRNFDGGDRESVYELYYATQVAPWLVITPDLQYIVNPGADKSGRDSLVAGVRIQMSF